MAVVRISLAVARATNMTRVLMMALFISLGACSTKSVYESIQHNVKCDCWKQPESERESCLKSVERSHRDYQRERQNLLNKTRSNRDPL